MRDLENLLDAVVDEESFLVFLEALGNDFAEERRVEAKAPSQPYGSGAHGWEHSTIDSFLDANVACARDNAKNQRIVPDAENPWYRCACILHQGKYYE